MCFFNHSTVTVRPQFRLIRDGAYKWVDATPPRELTVIDDDAGGAGFNVSGVLMQLDGDDAEGLAVSLAARHGSKLTDNWQIFGRSDAMLDFDRVVSSNLSVSALKVRDWNIPQAATVRAKPGNDRAVDIPKVSFTRVGQQRCGAKSLVLKTDPLQMAGGCDLKQCCNAVVNVDRKQTRKFADVQRVADSQSGACSLRAGRSCIVAAAPDPPAREKQ